MRGGLAARLLDPAFEAKLFEWRDLLGPKFQTIMSNELAARLLDPAFEAKLFEWRDLLGPKFQTFIVGTASRLLDANFIVVTDRWINLVGISSVCTIFHSTSFVSRLMDQEGFEAKVIAHFVRLGCNPKSLSAFLGRNGGKKLDEI
jgi:hypothetical protein